MVKNEEDVPGPRAVGSLDAGGHDGEDEFSVMLTVRRFVREGGILVTEFIQNN